MSKRKVTVVLCICAAMIISACLLYRHFHIYTAEDFGFEDKMASVVGIIRIDVIEYTAKQRPLPKK